MKGGKMNLNSYLEQIVGLKVLNVTHFLNLTGFVFGLCEAENKERILDNSYGLQLACPWILNDNASGENLAASGDFYLHPKDLSKINENYSKHEMYYTYLDEKLQKVLQEELYVEKIEIDICGDLKVFFSESIELRVFVDFSEEQYAWWFYKCGGEYIKPIQKGNFVKGIITCSNEWWSVKSNGGNLYLSNKEYSLSEVVIVKQTDANNDKKESLLITKFNGGELVEVGRKREDLLKDAPITWLKIKVPEEENENQIFMISLYCPWRIRDKVSSKILFATADFRSVLSWDDNLSAKLREIDFYEEKIEQMNSLKFDISKAYLAASGELVLILNERYCLETFINHSSDAVMWREYSLGKNGYSEGGYKFYESHENYKKNEVAYDFQKITRTLSELVGTELVNISRKGTYYVFYFEKYKEGECTQQQMEYSQLICAQQWRLVDLKSKAVLIGGLDCYYPCNSYKDNGKIKWVDTVNTRFEEMYISLFDKLKLQIEDVKVTQQGDLKIFFKNDIILEYFVDSSSVREEWQFRSFNGNRIRGYGQVMEVENELCFRKRTWMDSIIMDEFDKVQYCTKYSNIEEKRVEGMQKRFTKMEEVIHRYSGLIGLVWSPELIGERCHPWRLCDRRNDAILLATGDYDIPGEKTEWFYFFEDGRGQSQFDSKWEKLKVKNFVIESVKSVSCGDIIISLSDEKYVKILKLVSGDDGFL